MTKTMIDRPLYYLADREPRLSDCVAEQPLTDPAVMPRAFEAVFRDRPIYSKPDAVIPVSEENQALSDDGIYSQIYSAGALA